LKSQTYREVGTESYGSLADSRVTKKVSHNAYKTSCSDVDTKQFTQHYYEYDIKGVIMKHLTNILLSILFLFSFMSAQLLADEEDDNDVCPGESLTLEGGLNTFAGLIDTNDDDYYKILIPVNGNITIKWVSGQLTGNKTASLDVNVSTSGVNDFNGNQKYSKQDQFIHDDENLSFDVNENDIVYIRIYDGQGKNYTLTIDYDVDIDESTISKPSFCYEYAYEQYNTDEYGRNLTKGDDGNISLDNVNASLPVHINLIIRNINSTYPIKNLITDIIDIDITQATYSSQSIWVKEPGTFYNVKVDDSELDLTDSSSIKDLDIGVIFQSEYFTIDYDLDPQSSITSIDFPLNIKLTYDLSILVVDGVYATVTQDQYILDGDISMCEDLGSGYAPAYSIFNVEHRDLNNDTNSYYNLPTQVVDRVDDLVISSYKVEDPHSKKPVNTYIGVELIDLDNIAGYPDACSNPTNAISPRIWIPFADPNNADLNTTQIAFNRTAIAQGQVSSGIVIGAGDSIGITPEGTLSNPEDFYGIANKNTAFRVSFQTVGDDDGLIELERTNRGYRFTNFTELVQDITYCRQTVVKPNAEQTTTDLVAVACSDAGSNSTERDLAICMECLYGYDTRYLCSRDNFAIRPESYRVSLNDQEQVSPASKSFIKSNIDNNQLNIVSGYEYNIEVNATSYINNNPTPGYNVSFSESNASDDKYFSFVWDDSDTSRNNACNDITDHNKTMQFVNGNMENNISNTQIGHYFLEIMDKKWTEHDYDADLLSHHQADTAHFLGEPDCVLTSSVVPAEGTSIGVNTYPTGVSGCNISSNHTTHDTSRLYTDINTMIYPYKFDLNSSVRGNPIIPMSGPNLTRDQTFVYIDTPPNMDANDTNMSYNMNGTFVAVGYDDNVTSNFVTGCYADDVSMTLNFSYNYGDIPSITPFLSYSLKDYNATGGFVRPPSGSDELEVGIHNSTTAPFIIDQNATYFSKDMEGAIRMNLGYNFARAYNQVLNPRYIEFQDFNITYVTNPTNIHADLTNNHQIFGDKILDQNVSFFYGRAKPSKFFYEDITDPSVNTPISIVIYCGDDITASMSFTDCQDRGVQAAFARTNEVNWWLSLDHNTDDADGDVVLVEGAVTEGNSTDWSVTPTDVNIVTNAIDTNILVNRGTDPTLPLTVLIDLNTNTTPPLLTNRWLIYNENYNSVPTPFYKVRFIGESSWTGEGQTGHVVDVNASYKKSNRLDW